MTPVQYSEEEAHHAADLSLGLWRRGAPQATPLSECRRRPQSIPSAPRGEPGDVADSELPAASERRGSTSSD
ncbi:hypothetical protein EYF80_050124 [Liparis tanakae]|uniref:Uncharacterized protein n=1 Tax=Liparis tanakae TaxID=230148 RepID=A0A4Z2FEY9_9TELE|nr:hypothetical protein EYF80_050124 [Liparis tanakae]